MKRTWATVLMTGAMLVLGIAAAPGASAAPAQIEAGTGGANVFGLPSYNHDAGTVASMNWVGGGPHNVIASSTGPDGGPLFSSPTISSGTTAVNGTQYVPIGAYPFTCTIHSGMNSSLNVNAGTPLPRPAVTIQVLDKKLAKVAKKSQLRVSVTVTGSEQAKVGALLGKRDAVIETVAGAGTRTLKLKMTSAQRARFKKLKKATLKVQASIPFGSPVTATARLK